MTRWNFGPQEVCARAQAENPPITDDEVVFWLPSERRIFRLVMLAFWIRKGSRDARAEDTRMLRQASESDHLAA